MNILVTGGAGYIGTELIHALETDPTVHQVVVYDNLIRRNYNVFLERPMENTNKVKFVQGDILDSRKLRIEVEKADVIYHLAAKVTTPFADHNPHEFDQVNNWGTAELTYLVEGSNVSKLIYASSASVYGASKKPVHVGMPLNPRTFYGISKMHGEEHVDRLQQSNVGIYLLRLGNVYGYSRSMRFDSVINKFMFEANFQNLFRIFGDGMQMRSFIHVDRLSNVLKRVALEDINPGTYNITENTFTVNEIAMELKSLYPSLEMIYVNQNMKMRGLDVQPEVLFDDTIPVNKDILRTDLENFKANFSF